MQKSENPPAAHTSEESVALHPKKHQAFQTLSSKNQKIPPPLTHPGNRSRFILRNIKPFKRSSAKIRKSPRRSRIREIGRGW
jgi:hypothetical protein